MAFVRQVPRESNGNDFIVPVIINGVRCSALHDSGCNLVLVRESVLPDKTCYTAETIMISDVFGRNMQLNMLIVEISSPVFETDKVFKVRVAIDKTMQWEVIAGNQLYRNNPEIIDSIKVRSASGDAVVCSGCVL